jgi:hypothetical protein
MAKKRTFEDLTVGELRFRAMLAKKIADEAKAEGDPKWENAQKQHDAVMARIEVLEAKEKAKKPSPTVIGMQPAHMKARKG